MLRGEFFLIVLDHLKPGSTGSSSDIVQIGAGCLIGRPSWVAVLSGRPRPPISRLRLCPVDGAALGGRPTIGGRPFGRPPNFECSLNSRRSGVYCEYPSLEEEDEEDEA